MKHAIEPEELMAFLDGEAVRKDVPGHIDQCEECSAAAADLAEVSSVLMSWQVEPVQEQIPVALVAALREKQRSKPRNWRWARWAWAAAGLAAVVMVAFVPRAFVHEDAKYATSLSRNLAYFQQDQAEPAPPAAEPAPAKSPMIARSGDLSIGVKNFDQARANLEDILKRHQGYIGTLKLGTPSGEGRSLEAALRVPSGDLEAVMAEVKKLGRVEAESQQGEEVTQQYVDLDARLNNARNTEKFLTAMMSQSGAKLADLLKVEQEIARVRGDIEQMEAERKALVGRVDFATLNVKLEEDYKAQLQPTPGGRFRNAAIEGFRSMLDGVTGVALFLLAIGPSLLLWTALLFFPARFGWRKLRALNCGAHISAQRPAQKPSADIFR